MRIAIPLTMLATPAMAHHETVVVSLLPVASVWVFVVGAAGVAFWQRLVNKRRK